MCTLLTNDVSVSTETVAIREMMNAAIMDMPDVPEITSLIGQSYITYYHVKRIIELLKVSEKDTKSFFGSYSSQRMKDWLQGTLHNYTRKLQETNDSG